MNHVLFTAISENDTATVHILVSLANRAAHAHSAAAVIAQTLASLDVDHDLDPNDYHSDASVSALAAPDRERLERCLVGYLAQGSSFWNARDRWGRTPLHCAVNCNQLEMVQRLIMVSALDVNRTDRESGWSALHRAAYAGNLAIMRELFRRTDLSLTIVDHEGHTAMDLLTLRTQGRLNPWTIEWRGPSADADTFLFSKRVTTELYTWGLNQNYVLGHPDLTDRRHPEGVSLPLLISHGASHSPSFPVSMPLPDLLALSRRAIVQIAMARYHTMVVTDEAHSNVYSCGVGSGGRLGGTLDTCIQLRPVPGLSQRIARVALGRDHTVFLTATGRVLVCGSNQYGQLGVRASDVADNKPVQIQPCPVTQTIGPLPLCGIAAAGHYTLVYTNEAIYTFGRDQGQLGYRRAPGESQLHQLVAPHLADRLTVNDAFRPGNPVNASVPRGEEFQATPRQVSALASVGQIKQVVAAERRWACLVTSNQVYVVGNNCTQRILLPFRTFPNSIALSYRSHRLAPIRITRLVAASGGNAFAALSSRGDVFVVDDRSSLGLADSSTVSNPASHEQLLPLKAFLHGFRGQGAMPDRSPKADVRPTAVSAWIAGRYQPEVSDVAFGVGHQLILATRSGHVFIGQPSSLASLDSSQSTGKHPKDWTDRYAFQRDSRLQFVTQVMGSSSGGFAAVQTLPALDPPPELPSALQTQLQHTALLKPTGSMGESALLAHTLHRHAMYRHLDPDFLPLYTPFTRHVVPSLPARDLISPGQSSLDGASPVYLQSNLADMLWTVDHHGIEVHSLLVAQRLSRLWDAIGKTLSPRGHQPMQSTWFDVQIIDRVPSTNPPQYLPSSAPLTSAWASTTLQSPFVHVHFHRHPALVIVHLACYLYGWPCQPWSAEVAWYTSTPTPPSGPCSEQLTAAREGFALSNQPHAASSHTESQLVFPLTPATRDATDRLVTTWKEYDIPAMDESDLPYFAPDAAEMCSPSLLGSVFVAIEAHRIPSLASGEPKQLAAICHEEPDSSCSWLTRWQANSDGAWPQSTQLFDTYLQLQDCAVPCHRWVLTSTSQFFANALASGAPWCHAPHWVDSAAYRAVALSHVPWKVMYPALAYLYGDTRRAILHHFAFDQMSSYVSYLSEVLTMADELVLCDLVDICQQELATQLTVRNVVSLWQLADRINVNALKHDCMRYVCATLEFHLEHHTLDDLPVVAMDQLTRKLTRHLDDAAAVPCFHCQMPSVCDTLLTDPAHLTEPPAWSSLTHWQWLIDWFPANYAQSSPTSRPKQRKKSEALWANPLREPMNRHASPKPSRKGRCLGTGTPDLGDDGIFAMDVDTKSKGKAPMSYSPTEQNKQTSKKRWTRLEAHELNDGLSPAAASPETGTGWKTTTRPRMSLQAIVDAERRQSMSPASLPGPSSKPNSHARPVPVASSSHQVLTLSPAGPSWPVTLAAKVPQKQSQRLRKDRKAENIAESSVTSLPTPHAEPPANWAQTAASPSFHPACRPKAPVMAGTSLTPSHPSSLGTGLPVEVSSPGVVAHASGTFSLTDIQRQQQAEIVRQKDEKQKAVAKGLANIQVEEKAMAELEQHYIQQMDTQAGEWFIIEKG
ncbi:hypothetical protein H4R34_004050 [Dimargaris verticillata]|uniref:BTB domain-containing protein n=1 Tax=Dimargaris verticillata TaxID=2761393 RepID=A0A9W8B5P8_9FUNG|nr:hypothetical protein H4R34_004050 [Dimargaris verticillata]